MDGKQPLIQSSSYMTETTHPDYRMKGTSNLTDKDPLTTCMEQIQSRMTRGSRDLKFIIQLIMLRSLKEILYEVNRATRSQGVTLPEAIRRNRHRSHYPHRSKLQHRVSCDRCNQVKPPLPSPIQASVTIQQDKAPGPQSSLDNIYANFRDGVGYQLVSVKDERFIGYYFYPYYRNGSNVRPAKGISARRIRSWKDVREFRLWGCALCKAQ